MHVLTLHELQIILHFNMYLVIDKCVSFSLKLTMLLYRTVLLGIF